jgi:membrane associated rhomboid family serine protease
MTASAFYSKSKKVGASKMVWTVIGALIAIVPLELIPGITVYLTNNEDLKPLALMGVIVAVIILGAVIIKLIKPPKSSF